MQAISGRTVVTMPATAAGHGLVLTRQQFVDFGNACIQVAEDNYHVQVRIVDGRWGDEPTSPVVRARIAERQRLAA